VGAGVMYETNYYSDPDEDVGVFTYLLQPGVILNYGTPRSSVDMSYTLNAYWYDADDDIPAGYTDPEDDDYVGHTFRLSAKTSPTAKLSVGLDEAFNKTREAAEYDTFTGDTTRMKYYVNTLTPWVEYRFNERFTSNVAYRNTIVSYDEDSDEDAVEHRGIFDLRYWFWKDASVGLEYQVWQKDYDVDISDYTSNQVDLVVRKYAKYLYFEGAVGYHDRSFDDDSRGDDDIFTYRLAVNGQTSGFDEGTPKTFGTLALIHNYTDSGTSDNFNEFTEGRLTAGHVFLEKILTDFTGYYRQAEYVDYDRDDDIYGISGSIGYYLEGWATLKLTVGYENRDSNLDNNDYDNSYVMFSVGSSFPFNLR